MGYKAAIFEKSKCKWLKQIGNSDELCESLNDARIISDEAVAAELIEGYRSLGNYVLVELPEYDFVQQDRPFESKIQVVYRSKKYPELKDVWFTQEHHDIAEAVANYEELSKDADYYFISLRIISVMTLKERRC